MYRFFDEDGAHLHQLLQDGEWKNLTGTTTIIDVLGKPLTWWASGKAVELLGWLKPEKQRIKGVWKVLNEKERIKKAKKYFSVLLKSTPEKYLKALDLAYRAHEDSKKEKAEAGTEMHEDLELYIRSCLEKDGKPYLIENGDEKVKQFAAWAVQEVDRFIGSEVCCYSERLWVGGITDFVAVLKNGDWIIGDFKSSKEAYFSQFVQAGGYNVLLEENGGFTTDGKKLFDLDQPIKKYIIFPFGASSFAPKETVLTNTLEDCFNALVSAYRAKVMFEAN